MTTSSMLWRLEAGGTLCLLTMPVSAYSKSTIEKNWSQCTTSRFHRQSSICSPTMLGGAECSEAPDVSGSGTATHRMTALCPRRSSVTVCCREAKSGFENDQES
jgi:hypothetical protein